MKEVLDNDPHCLFINPLTLQIYCFECKVEIYDRET